jgi:CRP/FNR family transcriptional regulator, cyclic AMP receptor protein
MFTMSALTDGRSATVGSHRRSEIQTDKNGAKSAPATIQSQRSFDPKSFLAEAGNGRSIIHYRKDQAVYSQGEPADAVFYIQKGKVKVTVVSENAKEAITAIFGANDFFGEGSLAGLAHRTATVVALTDSGIMRLEKAVVVSLIHREPQFAELFISHLLRRTIRVEEDLVDQLFNSSERRLARQLLLLAGYGQEGNPAPTILKISQETLAEMIGTTRPRVSLFMNKFRKLGLIDYKRGIAVHSSLLNFLLHDNPKITI